MSKSKVQFRKSKVQSWPRATSGSDPKSKVQKPKSKVQNPILAESDLKIGSEIQSPKSKVQNPILAESDLKIGSEIQSPKSEVQNPKSNLSAKGPLTSKSKVQFLPAARQKISCASWTGCCDFGAKCCGLRVDAACGPRPHAA